MARAFSLDVRAWVEKAKDNADLVVRKVTYDAFVSVVMMSPVDTGRFRGNWLPGNAPSSQWNPNLFDKGGMTVVGKIGEFTATLKAGEGAFLYNNVPYAAPLEYGWSKQAPNGMVRVTVARFQEIVNKAVGSLP